MGSFYLENSTNSMNFCQGTRNNSFSAKSIGLSDNDTSIFKLGKNNSTQISFDKTFRKMQYDSLSEERLSSAKNNLRAFINGEQSIWS